MDHFFFKLFTLYWSVTDKQCCDTFRWTAKGLSHTYTCIYSAPNSPRFQAATSCWAEWSGPFLKSLSNLLWHCFCFYVLVLWPKACRILAPWPGIEPILPALEDKVLTTGPPGKFPHISLNCPCLSCKDGGSTLSEKPTSPEGITVCPALSTSYTVTQSEACTALFPALEPWYRDCLQGEGGPGTAYILFSKNWPLLKKRAEKFKPQDPLTSSRGCSDGWLGGGQCSISLIIKCKSKQQ